MTQTGGFCIYCGQELNFRNTSRPFCALCGGKCSACTRSSATDKTPMFCHSCGESAYISVNDPICEDCQNNTQEDE